MTSTPAPPPEPSDGEQEPATPYPAYSSYPPPEGGMPTYPQGTEAGPPAAAQPPSIQTAVRLMWAGAALSVVSLVIGLLTLGSLKDNIREQLIDNNDTYSQSDLDTAYNVAIGSVIVVSLLGVALWLLMARANGNGSKWARVVATALGVLNVLFVIVAVAQGQSTTLSLVISVIGAGLAIAILVLLWRKESTEFYNANSRRA